MEYLSFLVENLFKLEVFLFFFYNCCIFATNKVRKIRLFSCFFKLNITLYTIIAIYE